jgi:enoyl-[acyl-carrier protein] reductase II
MIRTPFCDLVGIELPIIQAPMTPWTTPELVAAVSNAGGLGSYATGRRPLAQVVTDIDRIRSLTDRPFAVNFLMWTFDLEAFEHVLSRPPAVISFAAGAPAEEIHRAKEAGSVVQVQVNTAEQAQLAKSRGADVFVAQGTEAGGLTGTVALFPLLPQVVDTVASSPVIAAGGIVDGRAMAAALVLGAQGVNIGTRFLLSEEAPLSDEQVQMLTQTRTDQTVRATILNQVAPPPVDTFPVALRSVMTPFLEEWEHRGNHLTDEQLASLRERFNVAAESGRMHEFVFAAGQSVGSFNDVRPAADIVEELASDAERALGQAAGLVAPAA